MKSPIVSKCRNSAPTDTPARLVITAADARAYPTSTMVSMQASSRRPTVSSRRCCWVLAMSGASHSQAHGGGPPHGRGPRTRPQVPARLHGFPVAVAELSVAEHDGTAHTRPNDDCVVAVDHAPQAAVERDLVLAVAVHRLVEARRVDH